jgi:hypothetical protein
VRRRKRVKPSDVTEDIAVVSGALATAEIFDGHPMASGILAAITITASALTAALLKQGQ